jgi:O-antigen/teichoic acid export membrane protein
MPPPEPPPTPREAAPGAGFGRNVVTLLGIRLVGAAAGFLTSIIAARVLGPAALGAAGIGLTVGTIAALVANGGLNLSSVYFLGRRPSEQRRIVHTLFTMGLVAAGLAAVGVVVAGRIALSTGGIDDALLAATASFAVGLIAFELSGSFLLGLNRPSAYLFVQALEAIGSFGLLLLVLGLTRPSAAGYVLSAALAYLVSAAVATFVAQRTVGGLMLRVDRGLGREALVLGLRGQVGNVLQFLNLRLDLLLVPVFLDLRAAGVYLVAVRVSEVVNQAASSAGALLFPEVARAAAGGTGLTERTIRLTLLAAGAAGIVLVVVAPVVLEVFFGAMFVAGTAALRITMVAMIPLAITRVLAGDLKGRGLPGQVSIAAGAGLVATVVLDLLLIPGLGIEGAALASLLAYAFGAAVVLRAYRRATGASLRRLVPGRADLGDLATVVRASASRLGARGRPAR